ncbi:MAG: hypothetical protein QOE82_2559, partial [Thermoanaerobaculia bacterium]|nr:hypothetical protein [Thermoanaerobaculia bacterium]
METAKPLELIGALIVFFVTYLYLPHIIFKTGAEVYVDVGRRRDTSELEEFLGSALPSIGLVVLTHLLNQLIVHISGFASPEHPWSFAVRLRPDWEALAAFITGSGGEISRYLTTRVRRGGESAFLVRLVIVSLVAGLITGNGTRRWLKEAEFGRRVPMLPPRNARRWWSWPLHVWLLIFFIMVEVISFLPYFFWYRF